MNRTQFQPALVVILLSMALSVAGCSTGGLGTPGSGGTTADDGGGSVGPPGPADEGTLRLLVTDKPFPFQFIEHALVTITEVRVHPVDDDCSTNGLCGDGDCGTNGLCSDGDCGTNGLCGDGDCGTNGLCGDGDCGTNGLCDEAWLTIFEGEKEFDLTLLHDGQTDLLADATVPAGTYNQLRLVVQDGEITLTDERVFPLTVPSGEQSGIKLHFQFEVAAEGATTLLLDVDMSRAFKPVPGGNIETPDEIREFKFAPSLGMRLIDLGEAGSIAGVVTNVESEGLPDVSVTAFANDEEVTSTTTGEDGSYVLFGLPAGVYRVEFTAAGHEDAEVSDVTVTAGATTQDVDVVLTPSGT